MKKLSVLFFALIAIIMFSAPVFSQNAESTGLTDADVKAFIKNYKSIEKGLDNLGVDIDPENATVAEQYTQINSAEDLLQKYGISGPNRLLKIVSLSNSFAYLIYEEEMEKDPESAAMMKSMGLDLSTSLLPLTSPDDTKAVKANLKALKKTFDVEETSSKSNTKSSAKTKTNKSNRSSAEDQLAMAFLGGMIGGGKASSDDESFAMSQFLNSSKKEQKQQQEETSITFSKPSDNAWTKQLSKTTKDGGNIFNTKDAKHGNEYTSKKLNISGEYATVPCMLSAKDNKAEYKIAIITYDEPNYLEISRTLNGKTEVARYKLTGCTTNTRIVKNGKKQVAEITEATFTFDGIAPLHILSCYVSTLKDIPADLLGVSTNELSVAHPVFSSNGSYILSATDETAQ